MPDRRAHRGAHPDDAADFAPSTWEALRTAVADHSWLLTRGYSDKASIKLVGDRYTLRERQRVAVMRSACSDAALASRAATEVGASEASGRPLLIDGYNVLITVEAALAGGVVLQARDGCYRDLASMHGTFRQVEETVPALTLVGKTLAALGCGSCTWLLDSPVSNSGRLRATILATGAANGWSWQVEVIGNPDRVLAETADLIATADSAILDRCRAWFNLGRQTIDGHVPEARLIPLATGP